jgi:hypothetical protein
MMPAATILRIAAFLAFVQVAAHAALFLTSVPHHGAEGEGVVAMLRGHHVLFPGLWRNCRDIADGLGPLAALVVLAGAAPFWCLALVSAKKCTSVPKFCTAAWLAVSPGQFVRMNPCTAPPASLK